MYEDYVFIFTFHFGNVLLATKIKYLVLTEAIFTLLLGRKALGNALQHIILGS